MKNVTITLDEDLAAWARVEAAKAGKSLSKFIAETLEQKAGASSSRPMTQKEALERFLAGPSLNLLDENGKPPSRSSLYE